MGRLLRSILYICRGLRRNFFHLLAGQNTRKTPTSLLSPHTGFDTNFMVDNRLVIHDDKTNLLVMGEKSMALKWTNIIWMHDDKTPMVVTKSIAQFNININLVISRRVNANASPDVPKPLYQWGGCASPLIQSFGCTDSARALRRTGSARALRRHNLEG